MVGNNGFADTVAVGGRLSREEFIAEYRWLLDNGVNPLLACDQLGIKPINAERRFWRYGENGLAAQLSRCQSHTVSPPPIL